MTESLTALEGGAPTCFLFRPSRVCCYSFVALNDDAAAVAAALSIPIFACEGKQKEDWEKSGEFKICKTDGFLSVLFLSFFCCLGKSVCVRLIYVVVSLLPPPPPPRKILDRPDAFSSLSDKRSNTSFPPAPKKREHFLGSFRSPGALH